MKKKTFHTDSLGTRGK